MKRRKDLEIHPLDAARWPDLERLFGARGACGGCWCMYWRRTAREFEANKGAGNKRAFKRLAASGESPGLIAYASGEPVGWCAVAPREAYPRLDRSRVARRVDEQEVWSIVCFFIAKEHRRSGLSRELIRAACDFARDHGATLIEAYPVDPDETYVDTFAYTGLLAAFLATGFKEVARRSPTRPVVRRKLRGNVRLTAQSS